MKIEIKIPDGWRKLSPEERMKKGDLWLDVSDICVDADWYPAYDRDPGCNMVGELVGNTDKCPNGLVAIRKI